MTATRILDTRNDGAHMTEATEFRLAVPAALVPTDVSALVLNLTVTDAQRSGFLTVYPCGTARPLAAAINFTAGETKANLVDALFRSGGALCLWSNVEVDAVVDLQGFHSGSGNGRLVPRTAVRLVDTRPDHALVEGQVLQIPVIGAGKAPAGTTTVTLNVAVDAPERAGFLTVYPCGTDLPLASNLNFVPGQTISNEVMVQPGTDGTVCVYTNATTHLVVDLDATFETGGSQHFTALVPGRFADTRLATKVVAGQSIEWAVVGDRGAPAGTTALSLNIAVTDPEGAGFLTVYPCGSSMPLASNLNFAAWADDQQPRDSDAQLDGQDLRVRQPHHRRGDRHRGHLLGQLTCGSAGAWVSRIWVPLISMTCGSEGGWHPDRWNRPAPAPTPPIWVPRSEANWDERACRRPDRRSTARPGDTEPRIGASSIDDFVRRADWSVVETGFGRWVSGDPGVPHPPGLCGIVGRRPVHEAPVVPQHRIPLRPRVEVGARGDARCRR